MNKIVKIRELVFLVLMMKRRNYACSQVSTYEVLENIYTSHEFSPAMEWPMWIVYAVMLFGYVLATIRAFQVMILHVKRFHERELTTLEQTMQDAAKEAEMAKGGDE